MAHDFISLAIIAVVAFVAPVIAQAIPKKPIPETVLLLAFGAILGPNCMNHIWLTEPITLLSDLGLAFLFLLAGYEINPKMLTGTEGKKGLRTWLVTFAFALALVFLHPNLAIGGIGVVPMAIVLVTTALGTLMPILRERELMNTKVGRAVIAYGTWGEVGPVLAMAVLLSTRTNWQTAAILAAFMILCVVTALVPAMARKNGTRLYKFLEAKANTTSQTSVRGAIMILVLAWSLGGCCRYMLGTGEFVADVLTSAGFNLAFLPAVIFIASGFIGFAMGTSWGTIALILPIVLGIFPESDPLFLVTIGATLAGAVYGDHTSPISDTTILSSAGAECDHLRHVATQIPYASVVAGVCFIGYFVAGLTGTPWFSLIGGAVLLIAFVLVVRIRNRKTA